MLDLTGKQFGQLIVIRRMDNDKWGKSQWLCRCDCGSGKEIIICGNSLKSGHTKSCGCLATKHGHSNDEIYRAWRHMKERCTNPNHKHWKDYGGRGITVCKRWSGKNGFIHFLEDMGERPPGLTLERKNNSKNYCKSNCRWATPKQQARNRRDNLYVPYKGENRLFVELCEEHNMPHRLVYNRFYSYNWPLEEALTIPIRRKNEI